MTGLRIVLITRTGRPSGAMTAVGLFLSGKNLVGIIAEKRRSLHGKGKRSILRTVLEGFSTYGLEFVLGRVIEAIISKARTALRKAMPFLLPDENFSSIEEFVVRYKVPFYLTDDHNGEDAYRILKELSPDIILIVNARVLSERILGLARTCAMNVHTSLLPKYAGVASVFWALYHGEKEVGVTVHVASVKLDTGDIILQRAIPVLPSDTERSIYKKTITLGAQMALSAVSQFENGTVKLTPQDMTKYSFFGWPGKKERGELKRRLKRNISN